GFAMIFYDRENNRVLPIFIGPFEANGILMKLQEIKFPRPLTYDLIRNILDSIGVYVEKVVINDLRDNTFYAIIYLNFEGNIIEIDSRPSDAVAIAVRFNAPIYVAQHVMEQSSIHRSEYVNNSYSKGEEVYDDALDLDKDSSVTSGQFSNKPTKDTHNRTSRKEKKEMLIEELQKELDKAVAEERYEDAARIRDEINKLKNK
ncbi:MAG: bifunctional nuclease domain-containing protein, partial [Brevinematia bacterium]